MSGLYYVKLNLLFLLLYSQPCNSCSTAVSSAIFLSGIKIIHARVDVLYKSKNDKCITFAYGHEQMQEYICRKQV